MIVEIIDPDHDHYGEQGKLTYRKKVNGPVLEIILENCVHNFDSCIVKKNQIKLLENHNG